MVSVGKKRNQDPSLSAQCGDFWRLQAAGEAAAELGGSGVKQGDEEATSTDRRV